MDYLVVGDYFSKFLLVRKIPNTSTHSVIKELGMIFIEFYLFIYLFIYLLIHDWFFTRSVQYITS